MARSLFLLACGFAAVAGLAGYAAYRCLRAAVRKENAMPVRDAVFMGMSAVVALTHALRERMLEQEAKERRLAEEIEQLADEILAPLGEDVDTGAV